MIYLQKPYRVELLPASMRSLLDPQPGRARPSARA